jgi:hypothetical protein
VVEQVERQQVLADRCARREEAGRARLRHSGLGAAARAPAKAAPFFLGTPRQKLHRLMPLHPHTMAKKNLASALAGQKARAAARAKQAVIDEALSRKAASIGAAARKQGAAKRAPTGEAAPLEGAGDGDDESAAAAPAALDKGKRRQPRAFERDDAVLLVGEGNFSFTLALLSPPHAHPPHLVTATALDSEAECCAKYPDAAAHVARIREIAGRDDVVVFGVDAGNLQASKAVCGTPAAERRYSKVWWGFPHCGELARCEYSAIAAAESDAAS